MKAIVIYDSFFGNTEKIARAIAAGLGDEVDIYKVGEVTPARIQAAELVVVGSPTRGFRPTKPIQELLKSIPVMGVKVAAFDTRLRLSRVNNALLTFLVKIFGYAAEPIARKLQKQGGTLAAPAEGFFVMESEGPLEEGEFDRASGWARKLA